MTRPLLTLKEFSAQLSISEALARKWRRIGRIRVVTLGRAVRVPQEEVDRLIAEGSQNPGRASVTKVRKAQ